MTKSKRSNSNNSTDVTLYNNSTVKTKERLNDLLSNIAKMDKQDRNLDNIDVVIGRPNEKLIPRELLIPAPEEWNFFPKVTSDKIMEMSESIKQYGLLHNITCWAQADGKYMILGGHTRVACYDYLSSTDENPDKWAKVPALVYGVNQLSETDAQRIVIISNIDQRELSIAVKAKSYMALLNLEKKKSLYGSYFNSREAAAVQANVSQTVFYRYLCLTKLIPELQSEINKSLLFMTGFHLSSLPQSLQHYLYASGTYKNISSQAAAQIKKCSTLKELQQKLRDIEGSTKYYKYTIQTRTQKKRGEEIVPLFIAKNKRNEFLRQCIQVVNKSTLSSEEKNNIITIMSNAML